jgi:hypothetical protein
MCEDSVQISHGGSSMAMPRLADELASNCWTQRT